MSNGNGTDPRIQRIHTWHAQRLASVKDNPGLPWYIRNPAKAFGIAITLITALATSAQWALNRAIMRDRQEQQSKAFVKEAKAAHTATETQIETIKTTAATAHGQLNTGIQNVARFQYYQAEQQSKQLEEIRKKVRAKKAGPVEGLKAAKTAVGTMLQK